MTLDAATFFTLLTNLVLAVISLISVRAALRSSKLAAKEFRLARMPVATIKWCGVRPTNGPDLEFAGYIQTVTDAPMFLERVVINTAMMYGDGNAGPFEKVVSQVPKSVVTKGDEGFFIRAVIRGMRTDALSTDVVGVLQVTITAGPAGLPGMSDTTTIVGTASRGGSVTNEWTEHEHGSPKYSPMGLIHRLVQPWVDGWKGAPRLRKEQNDGNRDR